MKKVSSRLLLLVGLLILFTKTVDAQVVINEVLPNPTGDDRGSEWVELYNLSSEPQTLKDCILYLHETDNNQKVIFGDEAFIDKFKVISWDGSFINNSGDTIRFNCPAYSDRVTFGNEQLLKAPGEQYTFGRSPDGTGAFLILSSPSENSVNSLPPTSTPIPTSTTTSTPKNTSTPTKSPTPKPSNTPTISQKALTTLSPTVSLIITNSNSPAPTASESGTETVLPILGEKNSSLTPTPSVLGERVTVKSYIAPLGLGLGSLPFLLFPIVKFLKKRNGDTI